MVCLIGDGWFGSTRFEEWPLIPKSDVLALDSRETAIWRHTPDCELRGEQRPKAKDTVLPSNPRRHYWKTPESAVCWKQNDTAVHFLLISAPAAQLVLEAVERR
jgi:hypothetical protein